MKHMSTDVFAKDMSAREIAAHIAAGELSSAEVVERFIARLEAVNSKLNAVTVRLYDSARKTAANVDAARARGEKLGPLGGVPVTIKECFDLAGTASTFGLTTRRDEIEARTILTSRRCGRPGRSRSPRPTCRS